MTKENILTTHYFIPKTEEIRYLDQNYQPQSYEEFMKTYESEEKVNNSYELELDSYRNIEVAKLYGPGWTGWIAKTAISIGAGFVLGPAAIPVGAAVWGGSKLVQNISDNDDVKKVSGFIGDIGRDTFTGGIIGGAAEFAGGVYGVSSIKEATRAAVKNTDKVVGKVAGEWAAKEIAKGGQKELYVTAARTTTKVAARKSATAYIEVGKQLGRMAGKLTYDLIDAGSDAIDALEHLKHLDKGISYQQGCEVCEA